MNETPSDQKRDFRQEVTDRINRDAGAWYCTFAEAVVSWSG